MKLKFALLALLFTLNPIFAAEKPPKLMPKIDPYAGPKPKSKRVYKHPKWQEYIIRNKIHLTSSSFFGMPHGIMEEKAKF